MYKITEKVALNPTVTKMVIEAPLIAKKAKPGQFIIVRPFEDSERIPLTVAGYDREKGTVDIIFQIVGASTRLLDNLEEGDSIYYDSIVAHHVHAAADNTAKILGVIYTPY